MGRRSMALRDAPVDADAAEVDDEEVDDVDDEAVDVELGCMM